MRDDFDEAGLAGWELGHLLAHDRHGFPGDPLPDGHLGSPANLAFWGSLPLFDHDDPDADPFDESDADLDD